MRRGRPPLERALLVPSLLVLALLAACTPSHGDVATASGSRPAAAAPAAPGLPPGERANIVLVVMDDFSMDLLPTMRSAAEMQRRGASYPHSFVTDSLCCVSRSSIFTGQYPHQTGVRLNTPSSLDPVHPYGGYEAFERYGNGERSFSVGLQRAGYTTGFVGKFMNRYEYQQGKPPPAVPPGWDEFDAIFGAAYDGWGFWRSRYRDAAREGAKTEAGAKAGTNVGEPTVRKYDIPPESASNEEKDRVYAGSVTHRTALDFIARHRDDERPWFLEVAPYAPHSRIGSPGAYPSDPVFPPAFRDRQAAGDNGNCGLVDCGDLGWRGIPGFDDDRTDNAPSYGDGSTAFPLWASMPIKEGRANRTLRNRARMVQSIDRMMSQILRHVPPDTYVVLTSDNGFHVGQHGLGVGKGAPYDSDVRVPLLVVGPGVRPGERSEVVSNIDLAPTFEDLAGVRSPAYRSGQSFLPTFDDPTVRGNSYAFLEHTWSGSGDDPDAADGALALVPSYVALRSRDSLLVRYDVGSVPGGDPDSVSVGEQYVWEFYEYGSTPYESANSYADPADPAELRRMQAKLVEFDRCSAARRGEAVSADCRDLRK